MNLQRRVAADLIRRAETVTDEVKRWRQVAERNVDGQGIHRSQVRAIAGMMKAYLDEQGERLRQIAQDPGQELRDCFAQTYEASVNKIVGVNLLWNLFRTILAQHRDSRFKELLTAADLIAADCYLTCLERAEEWRVIAPESYRVPPLVYLAATPSPLAVGTGKRLSLLDTRIGDTDAVLPIPVVDLPFDHTRCIWLLCSIHHEVGHLVDQELQLSCELEQELAQGLRRGRDVATDARTAVWQRWTRELVADTFGVLLGGAGFVTMLASLVLPAAPGYPALMPRRPHPDGYIRVSLLMKMLRTCGVADWTAAADAIDRLWYAPLGPKPDWIEPFVDADSDAVVDVLLNAPVPTLTHDGVGHSLSELVRDPGGDAGRTAALASYLGDGVDRPDPNSPDRFPWRLVPLAAQLASMQADGTTLETIHRRALQYLRAIERPEFLGPNVDRDAVTRRRARELDPAVLAAEVDAGGDANA